MGFKLFDPPAEYGAKLSVENMMHAFNSLGISITYDNAKMMIKRYDNDRDGFLSYNDVCEIYRPKDMTIAQEFTRRSPFDHK